MVRLTADLISVLLRYLETLGKRKDLVVKFVELVEKLLKASAGMSAGKKYISFYVQSTLKK